MSSEIQYVYQALAKSIVDHGIDTMFGLMGDANLFMVDDYVRNRQGTFVPVAYEGSAVLMALAFSKFSQSVGAATVTHGPGFTNCITALAEGVRGNTSMVLLCGDTPVRTPQNLQNIDQRELAKAAGAGFEQLRAPDTVAEDVANAFYRAAVEKRPIVLNMPADFMWLETDYTKVIHPVFNDPALVPEGDKKTVIVVDESSMIGNEQMLSLLRFTNDAKVARVMFQGDENQMSGVQAGMPFKNMEKAGVRSVTMNEIIRQRDMRHRGAITNLTQEEIREAFAKLTPEIQEVSEDKLLTHTVKMWRETNDSKTPIIVQTNKQKDAINATIKSSQMNIDAPRNHLTLKTWQPVYKTDTEKSLVRS